MNRPGESEERVGARLVPRDPKSPTTLVDAIREQALDGEFDPPPSPQDEEAGGGSRQLTPAGRRSSGDATRLQEATGPGFVTVYPCGSPQPLASNLNYTLNQTIPNTVIAKLGTDGKICLFTQRATHLVVDVDGAFTASG